MSSRKTLESTENKLLPLIQYEGADQGHEWPTRFLLWILKRISSIYKFVVQTRLYLYETGIYRRFPLGVQVISVGNVTVGGTGKTPLVEKLARELQKRGRHVAILSRGYRKKEKTFGEKLKDQFSGKGPTPPRIVSDGKNLLLDSEMSGDEPYMLATNLNNVVVLVDKDRVKSGRYAVKHFGCDTLILDDGFQYQKLKHRFDLVLVDRTNPFGNGNVLPRGILREPAQNIARAKFICITKAPKGTDTTALKKRIRELNSKAGIMECNHEPTSLVEAFTRIVHPLSNLEGKRVFALSGIASPLSFENSLEALGATIISRKRYADHHRFSQQEIIDIVLEAQEAGAEAIITTEKDAVRMTRIDRCSVPVYFVRIEVCFSAGINEFNRFIDEITLTNIKDDSSLTVELNMPPT